MVRGAAEPPVEVRVALEDVDDVLDVEVVDVPVVEVDVDDVFEVEVEVVVEVDLTVEDEPDVPIPKVGLRSEVSMPDEPRELPDPPEERKDVSLGFDAAGREVTAGRGGGSQ